MKEVGYFVRKGMERKDCFAEELLRLKREDEIDKEEDEMNLYRYLLLEPRASHG